MKHLTALQANVLRFIRERAETGVLPTIRELADHFGWASVNAATCHLKALERWGYIRRPFHRARAITLLRTETGTLAPNAECAGRMIPRGECYDCGAALFGVNVCPMCAQGIGRKAS